MADKKKYSEKQQKFIDNWNENKGQFKDPEKARAAQLKGAATRKRNGEMRRKLANKQQFIEEALVAATADTPEFMQAIITALLGVINSADGDPKDKLAALDRLTEITGLKAPKQTETKVETKVMSEEEAKEILNGLNVIQGGKG